MANEIQKMWENNATVKIAAVGGTFTLTLDAETTPDIDWNALVADIQAALEAFAAIGAGNVVVTETLDGSSNRIGLTFTFQGALANTNVDAMTVNSSLLQTANTIAVYSDGTHGSQVGAADVPVTPTLTTTMTAVAPAQEIQVITFDAIPDSGDLVVNGQTVANGPNMSSGDITTVIGLGSTLNQNLQSVTGTTGQGPFTITWGAGTGNISDSLLDFTGTTLTSNGAPVNVTVSTSQQGAVAEYQQDTLTTSAVPTDGIFNYNLSGTGVTIPASATAATIQTQLRGLGSTTSNFTVSGDYTGGFLITFNDTQGTDGGYHVWTTSLDSNTLKIAGQPQIVSEALSDSPTQGNRILTINGGSPITEAYNASTGTLATDTGWGVTGSGTTGSPFLYTAPSNAANVTFVSVEDGSALLLKDLPATIVTIQDGGVPPTAPSSPSATPISASEIDLSWTAGTTNSGVRVQKSLDGSTGWTLIATTAANATSYHVTTGLSAGTKYYFRMAATSAFGDSSWSSTVNATTSSAPSSGVQRSTATISLGVSL